MRRPSFLLLALAATAVPQTVAAQNAPLPSVMVFPPTATDSEIEREAGGRIAATLAERIATGGRVRVIAPPPATERKAFLEVARAAGAAYYVAGYLSALGEGASLVLQCVSVASGIVVSSTSAQVSSFTDVNAPAEVLRAGLLRHAGRTQATFDTPAPKPSASASPR